MESRGLHDWATSASQRITLKGRYINVILHYTELFNKSGATVDDWNAGHRYQLSWAIYKLALNKPHNLGYKSITDTCRSWRHLQHPQLTAALFPGSHSASMTHSGRLHLYPSPPQRPSMHLLIRPPFQHSFLPSSASVCPFVLSPSALPFCLSAFPSFPPGSFGGWIWGFPLAF